jgi:hypothetical protein
VAKYVISVAQKSKGRTESLRNLVDKGLEMVGLVSQLCHWVLSKQQGTSLRPNKGKLSFHGAAEKNY